MNNINKSDTFSSSLFAILEIAVEIGHHGGPIQAALKPPTHHSTIVLRGALNLPSLCRETSVSHTANVRFSSLYTEHIISASHFQ